MAPNNENRPFSLLLALPLEVRENIYQYFVQPAPVEDREDPEYCSEYWWFHNGLFFPSLLGTCGQIHDELAPLVYKRVRLSYDNNWPAYQNRPGDWLHSIGRNITYIQHCEIEYQTCSYTPISLSTLFEIPEEFHFNFPFYTAIWALHEGGQSLQTLSVSIERPDPPRLPRDYISSPSDDNSHNPPPQDMQTDEHSEAMRRAFFPEIAFTLRHLKWFDWLESVTISDKRNHRLSDPVLPYYLRGEMGFELAKISTRAEEEEGYELWQMGWKGDEGPRWEHWELVNSRLRGVDGFGDSAISKNKTWKLTSFKDREDQWRRGGWDDYITGEA